MGSKVKNSSEKAFQERFVNEMTNYSWSAPDYLNGNLHKVTVDDLIHNWRNELNRINKDILEGVELTDHEFEQVMTRVNKISNSYEAAKLLAAENGQGKIDGIWRDPNPKVTKKQITLTIFKKAQVLGGDSSYQIAREVSTANNRFDIVLLICGLPLINIEQKRTDKSVDEAFGQFMRYYKDGEYTNNFMAFSQMMVITSEIDTEYFATPKSLSAFNRELCFHWSDKDNNRITNWKEITRTLLKIPMAHQLVGDYLVINEDDEAENQCHMVMRPYQVYALQAVELAAAGKDGECDGCPHGGFVWHTTGSGKTVTSFKTALFLSNRVGFDKVVFLVDRKELDKNTVKRFKAYSSYESVNVDDTKHTFKLKKELESSRRGIIVTTTFKLNTLVKEYIENEDYSLKDKKIVFIIDEAHRTTMGDMMMTIQHFFSGNGLFFGFTGTPLFDENKAKGKINEKSELIDTTEKLFGPELHQYTIDEAIRDRNVLGFHIDYINTGEFVSYESLRQQLIKKLEPEYPDSNKREIERKVYEMSELDVEKECKDRRILTYNDETHIPRVVAEILDNWDYQSQGRVFNAILTTGRIQRAIEYAEEFERQQEQRENPINIAVTFSFGNENDIDNKAIKFAEKMFDYYYKFTGIRFIVGDSKNGEAQYFDDLVYRAARGGSGRNPKNIDLIIVADQLLTGYDSKYLNTLYVDRGLELQGLVQAYSRTNRIYGPEKEFGTIVNFMYPRITNESVDTALKLYGSGGESSIAIVDTYETALEKLKSLIEALKKELPNPSDWIELKDDETAKEKFNDAYKKASRQMNKVMQYYEFAWDDEKIGLSEHMWLMYVGAYKNLNPKTTINPPPGPVPPLPGATRLTGTSIVNVSYIIKLIGEKTKKENDRMIIDDESFRLITEKIKELSDMGEAASADLIREFVDDIVDGKIENTQSVEKSFEEWKINRMEQDIRDFSDKWGVNSELIKKALSSYSVYDEDDILFFDEMIETIDSEKATIKHADHLDHVDKFGEAIQKWMLEENRKFNVIV